MGTVLCSDESNKDTRTLPTCARRKLPETPVSKERAAEEASAIKLCQQGGRYQPGLAPSQPFGRSRPLRILCLHGRGANAAVTELQLCSIGLLELATCDFLNGPYESSPAHKDFGSFGKCYCWSSLERKRLQAAASESDSPECSHLDLPLYGVLKCLETHGPFDGIYGFSQGGGVVACLSDPIWLARLGRDKPLFRFAVLGCAVDIRRQDARGDLTSMPSLHLVGEFDSIRDESEQLAATWTGADGASSQHKTVHFPAGHEMPMSLMSDAKLRSAIESFLRPFALDSNR